MDIYVLDKNFNRIHIIDQYKSLIWANRYNEIGDCELMINATVDNWFIFKDGIYLTRSDDDMTCRIEKINIKTDLENGNFIIINGYDIKNILKQRIIWKQTNFNGLAENYIRKLIEEAIISPELEIRKISNFVLDDKANFIEELQQQVAYDNLQEKITEICKKYEWGYKVYIDNNLIRFKLYKGVDRTDYVVFSEDYENLADTEYIEDKSNMRNVALIAGEGEGVERTTAITGDKSGLERYEVYVDASDLSKKIEYEDLKNTYKNGEEKTIGGKIYYVVNGVNIAILTKEDDYTNVELLDDIYINNLISKGNETLAQYCNTKTFNGNVEAKLTYEYKKDYFLGDIVSVRNQFGISIKARIVEIIEVDDDNGYSIEPKFEYMEVN